MNRQVTVIDYGMGNLFSIVNALRQCGAEPEVTGDPERVAKATRLILPGVGAFGDGMAGLRERGLVQAILEHHGSRRLFLGICLGMQMMLDCSEEFGNHAGLGLIPGKVVRIESTDVDGQPHKIPHMGWNEIVPAGDRSWAGTLLQDVPEGITGYFVHSFTPVPQREEHRLADAFYGGRRLSAAIVSGNSYGTQFHPEKSGPWGLKMLHTFLSMQDDGSICAP